MDRMYKDVFHTFYLFSGTYYEDTKWQKFPFTQVFTEWNETFLNKFLNEQSKSKKPSLLIIEDMLDQFPRGSPYLTAILTKGRHYGISICISTQYLKRVPALVRTNMSDVIIFNISNSDELEKVSKEYRGHYKRHEFDAMLAHCFKRPFGFMWVDLRRKKYLSAFNPEAFAEKILYHDKQD